MRLVDSDDGDALSRLVGAVCAELRGARLGGPADDGGGDLRPLRAEAPGIGELRDNESVGIFRHWGWVFVSGRIYR